MSDATTIKVSKALRDRLQQRARADRISLGDAIERLLDDAARTERFERLRSERQASTTPAGHDVLLERTALDDLLDDPLVDPLVTATIRREVLQGDVWWAELGPSRGREQDGFRPVVLIASNRYLAVVDTLAIVLPVTTTDRGWSNHVPLSGDLHLPSPGWAMTEQPNTVSRTRLARPAGSIDSECLARMQVYLGDYLGF